MYAASVLRRFNRAYTPRVGVLDESFLGSGRTHSEARLLFEIGPGGAVVADLRRRLGLDSGFLSRLLRALERDGLAVVGPDPADGRRRAVTLTPAGRSAWDDLERRSEVRARRLLGGLDPERRAELADVLARAERLVRLATVTIEPIDPLDPAATTALSTYFAELDDRFADGFDPGDAVTADAASYRAPRGRFLVARTDDTVIGCGAVTAVDAEIAEIKRMWIDERWRGSGIGRRLLAALEREASDAGHARIVLDTNSVLTEAVAMYHRSGYVPTERYNENPYAHHWFTKLTAPIIRPFRPDDHEGLVDLVLPIQREEFGIPITLADQPDLTDPEGAFRADGGEVWVAAHRGEIVGSIGVLRLDGRHVVLRKMFLAANQRGSGLARALLDTAVHWAMEAGHEMIVLGTTDAMNAAHRFYAVNGFVRIDPAELPPDFPRMAVDTVFFRRPLDEAPGG